MKPEPKVDDLLGCLKAISDFDGAILAVARLDTGVIDAARASGSYRRLDPSDEWPRNVPFLVKDNIDIEGLPTSSGCLALANAMPRRDAEVVRRLRAAGAIILGKTHLSEFSFQIRSRSSLGGDVRNPFNSGVTAGGSSGGAAAAVAAGFAAAAIGTDTGGSIRTPASFNGLVGFRPTLNTISQAGVAPLAPSTDTVGTLTRAVAEAGLLFDVLVEPVGCQTFQATVPVDLQDLRIGVARQAFGHDPEINQAMKVAIAALRESRVTIVDPLSLSADVLPTSKDHVVDWEFGPAFNAYLQQNFLPVAPTSLNEIIASGNYLPEYDATLRARAAVVSLDSDLYRSILEAHRRLRLALDEAFACDRLDCLLYPTSAVVPTSLDNPAGGWAPELAACSGWPAITLPIAQAGNGIPIGLELLGRGGGDGRLLRVAEAVERLVGRQFRPDLSRLRSRSEAT